MKILEAVDATPDGAPLPDIHSSHLNPQGAMVFFCSDSATAEWIKTHFNDNSQAVQGSVLKVMPADNLPKPVKVAFKTRDIYTKDADMLLKRLQRYNPSLKSVDWRTLQKVVESRYTRWIFEVDLESAEAIKKANFLANTGVDKGTFKILRDPNTKTSETDEHPTPPDRRTSATSIEQGLEELVMETSSESTIGPCDEDHLRDLPGSPAELAEDSKEGAPDISSGEPPKVSLSLSSDGAS